MNNKTSFQKNFTKMLRELADRVESGEVEPRTWNLSSPVAYFAPPGRATYDSVHSGEFLATLELAWEDIKLVNEFWEKSNGYGGLLPSKVSR